MTSTAPPATATASASPLPSLERSFSEIKQEAKRPRAVPVVDAAASSSAPAMKPVAVVDPVEMIRQSLTREIIHKFPGLFWSFLAFWSALVLTVGRAFGEMISDFFRWTIDHQAEIDALRDADKNRINNNNKNNKDDDGVLMRLDITRTTYQPAQDFIVKLAKTSRDIYNTTLVTKELIDKITASNKNIQDDPLWDIHRSIVRNCMLQLNSLVLSAGDKGTNSDIDDFDFAKKTKPMFSSPGKATSRVSPPFVPRAPPSSPVDPIDTEMPIKESQRHRDPPVPRELNVETFSA
jgi:hypothetical protein